jgi:AcrR family transcriptional regulator
MAQRSQTRARGTLTREAVLRAAVDLADAERIEALSMRSLAKHLGVEAMSLYHHVSNKEDILDGMVDLVFAEIHQPLIGGPWREEMHARSVSGREVLTRHPWAVGLMDSRRVPGMQSLRHHDAVIGCLREAGFSLALVAHAFALLDAHLYGFMVQELSLPFTGPDDLAELADEIVAAIPVDELPHFAAFTRDYALQPGYSFGDEFEIGLDLILDALARQLRAERRAARG